jgi:hypothetical protein
LEVYEVAPQGQTTLDPSVAYDTVSYEPIINVYQTLIAYNGSSSANFVPELSTCVPGANDGVLSTASVSCQAVYGQTLITNNAGGEPEFWTFPIDSGARFYDGSTGVSWPVYPSDVMFSLARTLGFSDLPGPGVLNGWIPAQSLLPFGNPAWDGAIHFPFNNTPQNILGAMLVNDSTYCPASALAQNGCITFNAFGEGSDWPFFLELVADTLGSGIQPCGWYTAQSAGVPGFAGTTAAHGDGPCLLPGGSTNTSQSGFQNYLTSTSPTAWDAFEEVNPGGPPREESGVRFNAVGSGPYFLAADDQTTGYTLQTNPAYHQPVGCVGVGGGCEPAAGSYNREVVVTYESTDTEGIEEYIAGQADASQILPPETGEMVSLVQKGLIGVRVFPTISTSFEGYNLNFNLTEERTVDPYPGLLNVSSDFFASSTVRDLLNHAWPYTTIERTLWTVDGIQYFTNEGGAIPRWMGDYYPDNISWPYLGGDPSTNTTVNSAAWWWTQGTTPGSPYYDAELAACTPSTPCRFPIVGELGDPMLASAIADFIGEVKNVTGNALQPYTFDPCFPCGLLPISQSAYPTYSFGWAPDYPDPTDYISAMYSANSTYTLQDSLWPVLENRTLNPQYWGSSCGHDTGSWSDLVYWANYMATVGTPIPSSCQGPAYGTMLTWMTTAASVPVGSYRTLIYNEVEHIENQLGFYIWLAQENEVESYAPWINNATINTNPMIGAGGDQTWYLWSYLAPPSCMPNCFGIPHLTTNSIPSWVYAAIGVLGALTVVFLATALVMMSRRRKQTEAAKSSSVGRDAEVKGGEGRISPPGST